MNESTTITIDNIAKLIKGIAEAEYQRGYVAGLEEKRLTEKHWGRKQPEKKNCDNCKYGKDSSICMLKDTFETCGINFSQWEPCEEDKTELNNIIKNAHGSIENRINAAYNLGRREGYKEQKLCEEDKTE